MLLTGLSPMTHSACSLIEPRTTSSAMALSNVGWALHIDQLRNAPQSCLQANPFPLPIGQSYRGIFAIKGPSSQICLSL